MVDAMRVIVLLEEEICTNSARLVVNHGRRESFESPVVFERTTLTGSASVVVLAPITIVPSPVVPRSIPTVPFPSVSVVPAVAAEVLRYP